MRFTDDQEAAAEDNEGAKGTSGHEAMVALESPPEPAEPSSAFEAASGEEACEEVCAEKKAERKEVKGSPPTNDPWHSDAPRVIVVVGRRGSR